MITIKIAGLDIPATVKFQRGSINISQEMYGRSSLTFSLLSTDGTYRPLAGQSVEIYEGAALIWAGTIDEPKERRYPGSVSLSWDITAVDNHQIADRRIVNESYTRQPVGDIVTSIITDYLAAEGITAGTIQTGPDVGVINAPDMPASQLINDLAELVGYYWRINADKSLDFYAEGTFLADAIISSSDILAGSVEVWRDRSEYRNKQTITGIKGKTVQLTEVCNPTPDGAISTFYVRFPLAEKPIIEIDVGTGYVAVDPAEIGISGVDTGKSWYWSKGQNTIPQEVGGAALAAGHNIRLKYYGQINRRVVIDDPAAISERKTVEGGTGLYESVENLANVEGLTEGQEQAAAKLRRYARIAKKITMASESINFQVGEMRHLTFSEHDILGQFMVMSVNISDRGRSDEKLLRQAILVDGEAIGGYVAFFRKWLEKTSPLTLRENELITKTQTITESQGWSGELTVNAFDCLYPTVDLYPAVDLYPGAETSEVLLND